jgi:hypothetical protein
VIALAAALVAVVAGLAALSAWLTYGRIAATKEQLAARDLLDSEREQHRQTRGELDVEAAARAATEKKLEAEKKLRESVEVERNEAMRLARDQVAEHIRNAGVADAIRLVDSIYALPLPGVVREEVVPAGDPSRTDDDLLQPEL